MPTRIDDLRSDLCSLDDARAHFDQLARRVIALRAKDAACEKRIAEIKAKHNADADPLRAEIDSMAEQLSSFVSNHKELFKSPRKIKTSLGNFGMQTVSELVVDNLEPLCVFLMEKGYTESFKTVTIIKATAIRTRIDDGEKIPYCHVKSGDTAVYTVTKTLLEESEIKEG